MNIIIRRFLFVFSLTVFLIVFPLYLAAAETTKPLSIDPITTTWSAGEWILSKFSSKKDGFHTAERQAKFNKWSKEDWIKDDPYACMWNSNWINTNC